MKTVAAIAGAAFALAIMAGPATADSFGLYAYNAKGKLAKAGKYSSSTRVYAAEDLQKMKPKTQKKYAATAQFCDREFRVAKANKAWVSSHKKAKHKLVLIQKPAKGKSTRVCTL